MTKEKTVNATSEVFEDAKKRYAALVKESGEVEKAIPELSRQAARQRAEAARAGEAVSSVAADLEQMDLQERRRQLPLELWAQEIAVKEAQIAHMRAQIPSAKEAAEDASRALREATRASKEAREAEGEALRASGAANHRVASLNSGIRKAKKAAGDLEGNWPGADDDHEQHVEDRPTRPSRTAGGHRVHYVD